MYIICNMRGLKVFITFFVLYEFIAIILLQVPDYCVVFFNQNFCDDGVFKYFLICVVFPILVGVFIWWIPDILRLFCNQSCKVNAPKPQPETIQDVLHQIISKADIERLITAAIIMGIQKFSQTHPKTQTVFEEISKAIKQPSPRKK